ncbi:MAG TPA: TIM barrel protein [Terriglobales bacterium]|nr:TIM barrel protein [Terriglobales bacterium]
MPIWTRRSVLRSALAGAAAVSVRPSFGDSAAPQRKGRIRQSVSRWCFEKTPLDQLCAFAKEIGMSGIDLLRPPEYDFPSRYGLVCTMATVPGVEISDGFNRIENHAMIEEKLKAALPLAAKAGIERVVVFSGNRRGMDDEEGLKNTITGLKRVRKIGEDNNIVLCLELLNSKHNHPDYMCDHTTWGVRAVSEVNSPHVKLLYDIYHMQIMEGDLVTTIRENIQWIGHFHTGGVPGRHELDETQEVHWDCVMRAIADTGFKGYVAHEFIPARDPLPSLRQAVDLCDV